MANPKRPEPDVNSTVAVLVMEATDSKPTKGEDLIGDPKLRKAFKDAKKQARAKSRKK